MNFMRQDLRNIVSDNQEQILLLTKFIASVTAWISKPFVPEKNYYGCRKNFSNEKIKVG